MTQQKCGNCRFLDDTYEDQIPRCHRYPPQAKEEIYYSDPLVRQMNESPFWRFPQVNKENHWCGEWRPIDNKGKHSPC